MKLCNGILPTLFVLAWSCCVMVSHPAEAQTDPAERSAPLALLVRNADTSDGSPPFALADQYGRVQRYVEPSPGIDLASHVGTKVRVLHDTGNTLLASQLELSLGTRPLKPVAPEAFVPPRSVQRILSAKEREPLQTVQFDEPTEAADSGSPVILEDILPEPSSNAARSESIESIAVDPSLEPIVIEELPRHDSYRSAPSDDCPHCNATRVEAARSCPTCSQGPTASSCSTCKARGSCNRCQSWPDLSCCPPSRPGCYGRVDYLLWWFDGMNTPPLVTRGTTNSEAVLEQAGTTVVFGGDLLDDARSGLRFTAGAWLDDDRDFAIEGDLLFFETESVGFSAGDLTGASVIGRPFYNLSPTDPGSTVILPPAEDAQLVSFPAVVAGSVSVYARSEFESFGLRLRTGICCRELGCGQGGCGDACGSSCGTRQGTTGISRIDFITGYRYADLDESLTISEDLTSLQTANPGSFAITDRFETDNEFHGVDLGYIAEWETRRWALEFVSKIAIGSTRQRVRIGGSTTTSNNGTSFTSSGGLLALDSNIGTYKRTRFGVLPELSLRLGYKVTPDLRLSAGYSLLFWSNVVRPGDQIDLSIDPQFIPPATATPTASSHPQFAFHETSLWAHGFNFGADYRY